jgi:hypothetical protein
MVGIVLPSISAGPVDPKKSANEGGIYSFAFPHAIENAETRGLAAAPCVALTFLSAPKIQKVCTNENTVPRLGHLA